MSRRISQGASSRQKAGNIRWYERDTTADFITSSAAHPSTFSAWIVLMGPSIWGYYPMQDDRSDFTQITSTKGRYTDCTWLPLFSSVHDSPPMHMIVCGASTSGALPQTIPRASSSRGWPMPRTSRGGPLPRASSRGASHRGYRGTSLIRKLPPP